MEDLHWAKDLWLTARGIWEYRTFLVDSQYWPEDRLKQYQAQKIQDLLISAYEHTQYYNRLFWQYDIDPYQSPFTLDRLYDIPILHKSTARAKKSRLVNDRAAAESIELHTSGTTGDVFHELVSTDHWVIEQGVTWRHWKWMDYRPRDRMAIVRSYVPDEGENLYRYDRIRNFLYFSAYHLTLENARLYLNKMREWQPKILRGYPSSLFILANAASHFDVQLPPLKGVLTASETLLPHYRTRIEEVFNTRVFDWYGQAECTATFSECEAHQGMHLNSEYGIAELVKDAELPDGERRIVATCLHNHAMPLIRYDTGDIAIVKSESDGSRCSCGRTLPLIERIRGRSDEILIGPDGRPIPTVNLYTLMAEYHQIAAFQFIQHETSTVELRLQLREAQPGFLQEIEGELHKRLGPDMSIRIATDAPFIRSDDGKKLAIVPHDSNDSA